MNDRTFIFFIVGFMFVFLLSSRKFALVVLDEYGLAMHCMFLAMILCITGGLAHQTGRDHIRRTPLL